MRRFYPEDTVEYLINLQWLRSHCNANGVLVDRYTKYTLMELKNGMSIGLTRQAVKNRYLES